MIHNNKNDRGKSNARRLGVAAALVVSLQWTVATVVSASASASAGGDHRSRNLQQDNVSLVSAVDVGKFRPFISEAYPCIPPSEIKLIHENPNDTRLPWMNGNSGAIQKECYQQQNSCGFDTAPSACCRVSFEAGWLVCDAYNAFDFMPCVCNDNTYASSGTGTTKPVVPTTTASPVATTPTNPPTASPVAAIDPTLEPVVRTTLDPTMAPVATTSSPTASPSGVPVADPTEAPVTQSPTVSPTAPPTAPPTTPPTAAPTASPTAFPSGAPVVTPTEAPVTASPSVSPTKPPTASPTAFPTNSLGYTTENKFDSDLLAMIRQSQCNDDPPVIQFVQGANFVYRYEVTVPEGSSEDETAGTFETGNNLLSATTTELWKEGIHDELAREFLVCDGYDYDTVWILQSKPHVVDTTKPCGESNSNSNSENQITTGETPNDEDSNDFPACVSVVAEARMIAYRSPLGKKIQRQQLWAETTYQEGEAADFFALQAIAFLDDRLNGGRFTEGDLGFAPGFEVIFKGGEVVRDEPEIDDSDGDGGSDTTAGSDNSGNVDGTSGGSDSVEDNTSNEGGNLWSDPGTIVGIEASDGNSGNPAGDGFAMSTAMIATIAVVASCIVLLVFFGAVAQNRKRKNSFQEDQEYLQDVATPKSDSKHYSMHPVDHLELSDSSDDSDGAYDVELNAATSPGPKSNDHRGRGFRSLQNGKRPPLNFNFSGFAGVTTSPTSKERSKMGPLGLADEFREGNSNSSSQKADDSATMTHRGIVSNSSSMSSNNTGTHRGIVSNSSSMSSNNNNNLPPPPHQNNLPRLYQLRDTVKL